MFAEASDASITGAEVKDGKSGDTDFPFGNLKTLFTVGEYSTQTGQMLTGVPDGMGAYLVDDDTARVLVQSESYGPIKNGYENSGNYLITGQNWETYPFPVNGKTASFTGSHIHYVDYDRQKLADYMSNSDSAASMVKSAGNVIENAFNLKGEAVGPRAAAGSPTTFGAHYGCTDKDGNWVLKHRYAGEDLIYPTQADWVMQSLCSAHMETAYQWSETVGHPDDFFLTNEEWTAYKSGVDVVGISAHAVDVATKTAYAVGVFAQGGFEKIVEVNCGSPNHVCFAVSGYNGAFGISDPSFIVNKRNALGKRSDGTDFGWTQNVVPARLYVGVKGRNAQGQVAADFLSRNGLAYGKMYGFSTDIATTTGGLWRDAFHQDASKAANGATVAGHFARVNWQWDGVVRNFEYDGGWEWQDAPLGAASGEKFWTAEGPDSDGKKTEHLSPDPEGKYRYIQTSTAGYYGIYDYTGIQSLLAGISSSCSGDACFPDVIPTTYTVLQGELDVTAQIQLGGKGQYVGGKDATRNYDSYPGDGKVTFEDIDGFEWLSSADSTDGYVIIQEDSGNRLGERTFISKVEIGTPMTYYFIAMAAGPDNTRMLANVGIPARSTATGGKAEFSGVIDLSGLVHKSGSSFVVKASDKGYKTRNADKAVNINDKTIALGLQIHSTPNGFIKEFSMDRMGQLLAYRPHLPGTRRRLSANEYPTKAAPKYEDKPTDADIEASTTLK